MAKGIRALLDTVMQALPQVGNLGLLFFLLFFIFAALGVELFGRLGKCYNKLLIIIINTVFSCSFLVFKMLPSSNKNNKSIRHLYITRRIIIFKSPISNTG